MFCVLYTLTYLRVRQPHFISFQVPSAQPEKDLESGQCEQELPMCWHLLQQVLQHSGELGAAEAGHRLSVGPEKNQTLRESLGEGGLAIVLTWVVRGADIRVPAEILPSFQQQQNTRGE